MGDRSPRPRSPNSVPRIPPQFIYSSLVRFSYILFLLSPNPLPKPPVVTSGAEASMRSLPAGEGARCCGAEERGQLSRHGALGARDRETILRLRDCRALRAPPAPLQPCGHVSSLNFRGFIPHLAEELWIQETLSRAVQPGCSASAGNPGCQGTRVTRADPGVSSHPKRRSRDPAVLLPRAGSSQPPDSIMNAFICAQGCRAGVGATPWPCGDSCAGFALH